MKHYLHTAEEVFSEVKSSAEGLTSAEAEKRLEANGKNKLAEAKKKSVYNLVLEGTGFYHSFFWFIYLKFVIRRHLIGLVLQLFLEHVQTFQRHHLKLCTASVIGFIPLCTLKCTVEAFITCNNIFLIHFCIPLYLPLSGRLHIFLYLDY